MMRRRRCARIAANRGASAAAHDGGGQVSETRCERELGKKPWTQMLLRLDDDMPLLKYFGFACWVAWFSVAYSSSVWVEGAEETASVVSDMFLYSTLSHATALLACACFSQAVSKVADRPWFLASAGALAALGCVCVVQAGSLLVSSTALFVAGSCLTGIGTAALSINAGLLLCAVRPRQALRVILYCELLAALLQFMVLGLPDPFDLALFVALPLLSAACFVVGSAQRAKPVVQESQRLKPSKAFGLFLLVVCVLSAAANFGKGMHRAVVSPGQLAEDGSITTLLTVVCLVALLLFISLRRRELNFEHLLYPMALVIILSLSVTFFFPGSAVVGVVLVGVAFQLFDVVTWYMFSYIVYQSKASAVQVVALGRAIIALGVTMGDALGARCAGMGIEDAPLATAVFVLLFAAVIAVFFVFPERQVDKLLLPIPDEDDEGVASADASEVSAVEGEDATAAEHRGRWKQLCMQLGDERQLTEREKEVLVMLARGYGSQSISDALTISLYTTRAHTRNIYAKLDVHSRQELADCVRAYVEAFDRDVASGRACVRRGPASVGFSATNVVRRTCATGAHRGAFEGCCTDSVMCTTSRRRRSCPASPCARSKPRTIRRSSSGASAIPCTTSKAGGARSGVRRARFVARVPARGCGPRGRTPPVFVPRIPRASRSFPARIFFSIFLGDCSRGRGSRGYNSG